uniref:caspase family protein n=1 Tax=Acaryochloris sp. IP29b_bin.137 TaxID=2969217 RepID=UPI00262DD7E3
MPNYYLVACGTSESDYPEVYPHLEKVPNDLSCVTDILTSHFDYTPVLECLSLNPSADSIKKEFAKWLISGECTAEDCIVFYYSGHGEYLLGDQHCLILKETDPAMVGSTSLPTDELIRPLQNPGVTLSQILFIIDTCYSGEGAGDITQYA